MLNVPNIQISLRIEQGLQHVVMLKPQLLLLQVIWITLMAIQGRFIHPLLLAKLSLSMELIHFVILQMMMIALLLQVLGALNKMIL